MDKQFGNDDPRIADFLARTYAPEDATLREIRERSAREGLPDIQVASMDARHLEVLARALGARRAVEIGSLGGYSGVAILRGMTGPEGEGKGQGDDGGEGEGGAVLHTFELKPHHAEVAAESFRRAGFAARARIHVGRAIELLPAIEAEGPFDLVFLDADKEGYPAYLDWAARNLRRGGAVIGDNAFLFGQLPDDPTGEQAAAIAAMRAFHETLATSGLFRATVLPTGEGLAIGIRV